VSDTSPQARLYWRRFGAGFAGFACVIILSTATDAVMHGAGIFPPAGEGMTTQLWLLATTYRIVYGVLGSYIAARLAPDKPMQHAMALGYIGFALSVLGAVATWGKGPAFGPTWYPLAIVAIALPCAWLGGKLGLKQRPTPA